MFAENPPRPAVDNILVAKMRGGQVRVAGGGRRPAEARR